MTKKEYSVEVGGRTLTAEFNDIANQADGSVLMRSGDTVVLATAVMSDDTSSTSWFPLRVDYEERFYAAGQILGSRFIRREGRPSEEAVLSGRVVDRTIRPLFDNRIRNEVQVVITILSLGEDDPDVLAVTGASLALATSDIPWNGPVSAVRIGSANGTEEFRVNPRYDYREQDDFALDLLACGKDGKINMIEVGSKEIGESVLGDALEEASSEIEKLQAWQQSIIDEIGKEKREVTINEPSPELVALFNEKIQDDLETTLYGGKKGAIKKLEKEWKKLVGEELPESAGLSGDYFNTRVDDLMHKKILTEEKRPDGRALDEIRPLYARAGELSEALHGSGLFYRGGTHVLSVLTLGSPSDMQVIEGMEEQTNKRFFHHYNFPPFSVGEAGRIGGFNRREIGHGALAEKALRPILPPKGEFPHTIRIVSEALASNGSTSMGSVCGSSLALMDAGVPVTRHVAGIAMGVIYNDDSEYKILTDIQGPEDHHGDMDFKVAGTREGVTAVQMDVKVEGVSITVLREAFEHAKTAREKILTVLEEAISEPRKELAPSAPRIVHTMIPPEKIGLVIGSGGKTINEIRDVSGVEDITIEDDGNVYIMSKGEGAEKAKEMIEDMTHEYKEGEKFDGVVTKILDFGAFVRIGYNTEGLVHISEIAPFRVETVSGILEVGETVPVVVKEIDDRGRVNLSIKQIDPDFAKKKQTTTE